MCVCAGNYQEGRTRLSEPEEAKLNVGYSLNVWGENLIEKDLSNLGFLRSGGSSSGHLASTDLSVNLRSAS